MPRVVVKVLFRVLVGLFLLGAIGCGVARPHGGAPNTNTSIPNFITGYSVPSWGQGQYTSNQFVFDEIDAAVSPNCMAVVVTHYTNPGSTEILATSLTPTDFDITSALKKIKSLHKCAVFIPHVDFENNPNLWGANVGDGFSESQWQTFQTNYTAMVVHYANLCEQQHCDMMSLGNEFQQFSQRESYWRGLVQQVRNVFHGKLTYDAFWNPEVTSITWWDALDFIGVNVYLPVGDGTTSPSVDEVKNNWDNFLSQMQGFSNQLHKKVLILEVAYSSYKGMSDHPSQGSDAKSVPDQGEQANAFEGMFESIDQHKQFLAGLFVWFWPMTATPYSATDNTVAGKQAETTIAKWFNILNKS